MQFLEDTDDLPGPLGVQIARGLVRQDDRWFHHEGTGDRHPLLFATGHLDRTVPGALLQSDPFHQLLCSAPAILHGTCRIRKRKHDVLESCHLWQQVVRLEHESHVPVPHCCQVT